MENINWARFWGVFFFIMLGSYIFRIFLWKKGIIRAKAGFCDKLIVIGLMPFQLFRMWQSDALSMNAKAFSSVLGIGGIVAGIVFLYLSRRKDETSQNN